MNFSVIIPSKNVANLTVCIEAIRKAGETCPVFVVDDGLESHPPGPEYLTGVKPFIFSRNVNLGILAAEGDAIILNDDGILKSPMGFTELARAGEHYGVTSAAIEGDVGNLLQQPRNQGTRLMTADQAIAFVCVFIPRWVLRTVGLLDERFTGYGCEDVDYCQRVLNAKLEIAICDDCIVEHHSLPSTFRHGKKYSADLELGRKQYREKWNSPPGAIHLLR